METVPYLDLRAEYRPLRSEVLSAFEEICESTSFAQGSATSKFEAKFAAYCGVHHCVSLNSGTSALHLALRCLDVGPGDEVVTVSMTFIATASAITRKVKSICTTKSGITTAWTASREPCS